MSSLLDVWDALQQTLIQQFDQPKLLLFLCLIFCCIVGIDEQLTADTNITQTPQPDHAKDPGVERMARTLRRESD